MDDLKVEARTWVSHRKRLPRSAEDLSTNTKGDDGRKIAAIEHRALFDFRCLCLLLLVYARPNIACHDSANAVHEARATV